jgi:hypothetical protein
MTCGKPCECPSYAEHLRSITVGDGLAAAKQRRWDREMSEYARAKKHGVQPGTVSSAPEAMRALGD